MGTENKDQGIDKKQIDEALEKVESKLTETLEKYEGQVQETGKAATEVRAELKALSEQHAELLEQSAEYKERVKDLEQKMAQGFRGAGEEPPKSIGQQFVDSDAFKNFNGGQSDKARIEVKNTILGESGSPQDPNDTLTPADRLAGIVPGAFRALNILDFFPVGTTASNQIEFTREASFTNAAAEKAEGAAKPESTLTFELVALPVRTIPHYLKASKQVLDDAPMLRTYIDRRLTYGVQKRLQTQILTGNGTSPNLAGLTDSGNFTAFTPTSGENALDSLNRIKHAVIAQDYMPDFIFLNPADWGSIERIKRGSSDAGYVAGDGAGLTYIGNGLQPMVWGIPVVASNDVTSGKVICGSSQAFQLFIRQGVNIQVGYENDDFTKNLVTILAEMRAALAVYTPAAIHYGDLTA